MNKLFQRASKWAVNNRKATRVLRFEQVEARQLMTVNPVYGPVANIDPSMSNPNTSGPVAEGNISFNSATGVLTIDGTDAHADTVKVYISRRTGNGTGVLPDLLTVELANINSPQVRAFDPALVKQINFNGYAGDDFFDNRTSITSFVDGGRGNDILLGGTGGDSIWGNDDYDYIDGRAGHDMLLGGAGVDSIFGDAGDDNIYGGAGIDHLFGGNGVDKLFGESGIDFLYGGAGTDSFVDGQSQNKFQDYGADKNVSHISFGGYDWFDRNLKDASVRSLIRLQFRDGLIDRNDTLRIYTQVSTEGVNSSTPFVGTVSTNELSDLKALVTTRLNIQANTKYFANKIANGDRANQWYKGGTLGNLTANVSADRLNKLIDKWFKGADLPEISSTTATNLHYEEVAGELFVDGVSYTDVYQGQVGDCYLMASLGEVAQHASHIIRNMFGDNGDGTWTVRLFANGSAQYVTVNRMLPVHGANSKAWAAGWGINEFGRPASTVDYRNELWVALAEKAYVQMNEMGIVAQDGRNAYLGIEAGQPRNALGHITGRRGSDHFEFDDGPSELINSINAGRPVVLTTKHAGIDPLLVEYHAYMVTGYNPTTKMFTLFNPWGLWNTSGPNGSVDSPVVEMNWASIAAYTEGWTDVNLL